MYQVIFLGLITLASTHDLNVGTNAQSKKIFDENFQASPAIWRQKQNVTINTTDDEVISRIVVTDLREEKDGDAKIVDGGEGQKTVTLELQSPTVLRGFDFHVEVYAAGSAQLGKVNSQNNGNQAHPSQTKANEDVFNKRHTDVNLSPPRTNLDSTAKTPDSTDTRKVPLLSSKDNQTTDNPRRTRDTETKEQDEAKLFNPSIIRSQDSTTAKNKDEHKTDSPKTLINGVLSNMTEKNDETTTKTPSLLGRDFKRNNGEARHTRETEKESDSKQNTSVLQNGENQHKHAEDDETSTLPAVPKFVALNNEHAAKNPPISRTNATRGFGTINRDSSQRKERDTHSEEKEINIPRVLTDNIKNPPKIYNKNAENVTNEQQRNSRSTENEDGKIPSTFGLKDNASSSTTSTTTVSPRILPSGQDVITEKPQIPGNFPRTFPRAQNYPAPYPYVTTPRISTTTNSQQQKRDTDSSEKDLKVKENDKDSKFKSLGSVNGTTEKAPVISIQ